MKNRKKLSRYSWILLASLFICLGLAILCIVFKSGTLGAIMLVCMFIFVMGFACAPDNEKYT